MIKEVYTNDNVNCVCKTTMTSPADIYTCNSRKLTAADKMAHIKLQLEL